jgi:hypothetical protein
LFLLLMLLIQASVQAPPRDARPPAAAASGGLRGVVVDAPSGAPVSGARVSVSVRPSTLMEAVSEERFSTETETATDGTFELTGLPAGELVVMARPGEFRATHLPKVVGQDGPGPFMGTASLTLDAGEVRTNLRIALERGLAIEGSVTNEFGEPMVNVSVTATAEPEFGGRAPGTTDDRGRFRLFGLRPGEYTICASPYGGWSMRRPAAETVGPLTRYDKTCLPQRVILSEGQTPMVQIHIQPLRAFSLSGSVVSSTGRDLSSAHVSILRIGPDGNGGSVPSDTTRDGRFVAGALVPGEYIVRATVNDLSDGVREVVESASISVRIDEADVTGLTMTTLPAATITGRVVLDPRATSPRPLRITVRLLPPMNRMHSAMSESPSATVARDGSFTVGGIFGPQVVAAPDLSRGWFVASVRHGDEDITAQVREFRAGDERPVTIVLSNRGARLRARATGDDGRPRPDALVVLVSADPKRWNMMPFVDMTTQDKEGFIQFESVAPGDYFVAALPIHQLSQLARSAETLEPIARAGRRITLVEGEPLTLDVPVLTVGGRQ